jgi:hypothetical protein
VREQIRKEASVCISPLQVLSNAVLLVDKPARWSSTDVVRQLKSALKYDKICFAAPLDTEATGLLIVLLGRLARLLLADGSAQVFQQVCRQCICCCTPGALQGCRSPICVLAFCF